MNQDGRPDPATRAITVDAETASPSLIVAILRSLIQLFLYVPWKYSLVYQHTNFNTGFNTPPERSLGVWFPKEN